jgi:hypothetical protein
MATTAYYGTRLGPHISRTPEGFVIAHDVPLCRTAERVPMMYRGSELGLPTDDTVSVYRSAEEVMHPKHIASIEAKPVLDGHTRFVDAETASWSTKGHVQNVRKGPRLPDGEKSVIGDIIITDATLAQKVLDGQLREVSLGYDCEYAPRGDGTYSQRKLRVNHCALVPDGRAGEHVRINDAAFIGTFAEMAREFHRRNPSEVAAEHSHRAEDRLPEALRRGEPHSWDALAEEHRRMTTREEESDMLKNFADEDLITEEEDLETANTSDAFALAHLRKIRPVIQATGDRKAIDGYNAAIKELKRRIRDNRELATDARHVTDTFRRPAFELGSTLEDLAKHFHRRDTKQGLASYEAARARPGAGRATDSLPMSDESWADTHREAGRKMREKKH